MKTNEIERANPLQVSSLLVNCTSLASPSPLVARALRADARYAIPEKMTGGVIRVLAQNPKDYTGPGTNTYLVGQERLWIIDPGPRDQEHIKAVVQAVEGRPVEGVFVTHTHMDHSPAAQLLADILGAPTYGMGPIDPALADCTAEAIDMDFTPDHLLEDGALVTGADCHLQAVHTPGHFPNHLCFWASELDVLFSGDHVMGWSTTAIVPPLGNLSDYMASLDKLAACGAGLMLPSHGPKVVAPKLRLEEVRRHRAVRHGQVIDCIQKGIQTVEAIVDHIYEGLTPGLLQAAAGQIQAHIEFHEAGGVLDVEP